MCHCEAVAHSLNAYLDNPLALAQPWQNYERLFIKTIVVEAELILISACRWNITEGEVFIFDRTAINAIEFDLRLHSILNRDFVKIN